MFVQKHYRGWIIGSDPVHVGAHRAGDISTGASSGGLVSAFFWTGHKWDGQRDTAHVFASKSVADATTETLPEPPD
jgi:hypothetical protein